jgi:hypothetical protein
MPPPMFVPSGLIFTQLRDDGGHRGALSASKGEAPPVSEEVPVVGSMGLWRVRLDHKPHNHASQFALTEGQTLAFLFFKISRASPVDDNSIIA